MGCVADQIYTLAAVGEGIVLQHARSSNIEHGIFGYHIGIVDSRYGQIALQDRHIRSSRCRVPRVNPLEDVPHLHRRRTTEGHAPSVRRIWACTPRCIPGSIALKVPSELKKILRVEILAATGIKFDPFTHASIVRSARIRNRNFVADNDIPMEVNRFCPAANDSRRFVAQAIDDPILRPALHH